MLAEDWTGVDAGLAPYCTIKKESVSWVEKSFLEGNLPINELLSYLTVIKKLPLQFETVHLLDD